jgi:hypothetical protein
VGHVPLTVGSIVGLVPPLVLEPLLPPEELVEPLEEPLPPLDVLPLLDVLPEEPPPTLDVLPLLDVPPEELPSPLDDVVPPLDVPPKGPPFDAPPPPGETPEPEPIPPSLLSVSPFSTGDPVAQAPTNPRPTSAIARRLCILFSQEIEAKVPTRQVALCHFTCRFDLQFAGRRKAHTGSSAPRVLRRLQRNPVLQRTRQGAAATVRSWRPGRPSADHCSSLNCRARRSEAPRGRGHRAVPQCIRTFTKSPDSWMSMSAVRSW